MHITLHIIHNIVCRMYIYIIAYCISTVKYQIAIKYQLLYTIIPGKYLRSRNLMWNPSDRGTWKHAFLLDLWPYSKPPAVEFPPNGTADEPLDFEVPQVGVGYQLFQTTQAATTSASDCPLYSMVISGTDLLEVPIRFRAAISPENPHSTVVQYHHWSWKSHSSTIYVSIYICICISSFISTFNIYTHIYICVCVF